MNVEERAEFAEVVAQAVMDRMEARERINRLTDLAVERIVAQEADRPGARAEQGYPKANATRLMARVPSDPNGCANQSRTLRKIILKSSLSPGDILMLTAAVRDLALSCPGQFQIDVRTPCPALWENNPYLTALSENASDVEVVDCEYPLIHQSNRLPYHFIHAFRLFLEEELGVSIQPQAFRGDIHLRGEEKEWLSQVDEILERPGSRFWIIVSGGKQDFTAKWWDPECYQDVVNHFQGRIQFVQVGEASDYHVHPPLQGVIDLVGKTDLRQMVRLMHHADGVVCPVTMLMHLAAAVETKPDRPQNRPCVVIAGGREPAQWEAYPHHQYLHTNGSLPCCDDGGCWKSRVVALGDGDEKDQSLCLLPVVTPEGRPLPMCMSMIKPQDVIAAIERYLCFDNPPDVSGEGKTESPQMLFLPAETISTDKSLQRKTSRRENLAKLNQHRK